MTSSEETREQTISNVETEYHEINSKGAWPILYQVREGTRVNKGRKEVERERKREIEEWLALPLDDGSSAAISDDFDECCSF